MKSNEVCTLSNTINETIYLWKMILLLLPDANKIQNLLDSITIFRQSSR